jgi:hypothetical protein
MIPKARYSASLGFGALVGEHGREGSLGDSILKELYSFIGEGSGSRRTT